MMYYADVTLQGKRKLLGHNNPRKFVRLLLHGTETVDKVHSVFELHTNPNTFYGGRNVYGSLKDRE